MITTKKMETWMSIILLLGTLVATLFVIGGGALYLWQHGNETIQSNILQNGPFSLNVLHINVTFLFSPLGLIAFGLLTLVFTQILRVGLLAWFYATVRDYRFMFISFFILIMLVYSFFLRH